MALFLTPSNAAVAVVCHDGICALQTLPIEIGADYMTKSDALGPVQPTFAMPDGLKPEYFGNYPGVSIGTEESSSYLLSANKGDGNWTAVMLDKEGFHIMEDIAAESLIPFRAGSDAGYIATYGGLSLFRLVNPENGTIGQAIYTCKIGQIISATSNSEKPGHILLNVSETSNGLQIYDLGSCLERHEISIPYHFAEFSKRLCRSSDGELILKQTGLLITQDPQVNQTIF